VQELAVPLRVLLHPREERVERARQLLDRRERRVDGDAA
jgi:hypothetical protein